MRKTFQEINSLLGEKLRTHEPFSCIRLDNTAGYVFDCLSRNTLPSQEQYNAGSLVEAGIYPSTLEYSLNVVFPLVLQAMQTSDILGFVDCSRTLPSSPFVQQFSHIPCFYGEDFLILDPGAILGYSPFERHTPMSDPWTRHLKGKRVLVISTHADSIKQQWKQIDKVWGSKKDDIVPFELVDVIRSPYHPAIDQRQYPNCTSWDQTVEAIKKVIDTYEYDVLLAGATTSSPIYVAHAKERGKVGIQTGGTIQIFFGILGYRWTQVEGYKNWHNMYNDSWIYPLKSDEAQQRDRIRHLESMFAYWG